MRAQKRIPAGQMLIGPDHYGCSNTGMAPALLHSRALRQNPTVGRGYKYAIGPEVFVQEAVRHLVLGKVPVGRAFVEFNGGRDRVTFTKTIATARKRYDFLVAEITTANAAVRAKHVTLRAKAQQGDMQAAVDLLDY